MSATPTDEPLIHAAIGWEVRNWSRALPFWQRHLDRGQPRRALALGERGGGLSLWLASQGIEVTCTDLDASLDPARDLHERFGVGALVTYENQDATAISHPDGTFDVVVFKSVIGALQTKERQLQAISEMHRVLAPGGLLFFAENLVGSQLHVRLRRRFVRWERSWRYIDLAGDMDLFDAFDEVEFETWGFFGALGRSERQRDLLGRIDAVVVPHVAAASRYIVFGACHKGDRTTETGLSRPPGGAEPVNS